MSKIIAFAAAAAAATMIAAAPASAGYDSYRTYEPSYQQHYYKPSYHQHYYKPTYTYQQPTYYKPRYEHKVEEICFKWTKDGYGHATKVIIPCPVEKIVIKKEVTVEKKIETPVEKPVEQKPVEEKPVEQK